jgi:hypothetical protein
MLAVANYYYFNATHYGVTAMNAAQTYWMHQATELGWFILCGVVCHEAYEIEFVGEHAWQDATEYSRRYPVAA